MIRALLFGLIALAGPASAQHWSQFRGPASQGVAQGEPLPRTFTKANEHWRLTLDGSGHSSPVIWGKRLYLTSMGVEPNTRVVVCFDTHTGERIWTHVSAFEPHKQHRFNSFASATPALDAQGVYIVWSSGNALIALALDHEGEERWTQTLGPYAAQHGSGASPIVYDDLLVVSNEHDGGDSGPEGDVNELIALDTKTGEFRWRIPRTSERMTYATPVPIHPAEGEPYLLFASAAHGLTAVDPATGKIRYEWSPGFSQRIVATPALSGTQLFFSAGSGDAGKESSLVQLPSAPGQDPRPAGSIRRALPYVPCALALNNRFYLISDGGVASCISAKDGAEHWRERLDGTFYASPVSDGQTLYLLDRDGRLFSLAPGDEFSLLGSYDLGATAYATPAIAHGRLYVRTVEHLICLGQPKD